MKNNLQYIFDKITRRAPAAEEWKKMDRIALIDLAIAIGAADRGVAITEDKAGLLAETVMAARARIWPTTLTSHNLYYVK